MKQENNFMKNSWTLFLSGTEKFHQREEEEKKYISPHLGSSCSSQKDNTELSQ